MSTKDDRYNRNPFVCPICNKEVSRVQAHFSRTLDDAHQKTLLDQRDRAIAAFYDVFFDAANEHDRNLYGLFLDGYAIIKIWRKYFSKELNAIRGNLRRSVTGNRKGTNNHEGLEISTTVCPVCHDDYAFMLNHLEQHKDSGHKNELDNQLRIAEDIFNDITCHDDKSIEKYDTYLSYRTITKMWKNYRLFTDTEIRDRNALVTKYAQEVAVKKLRVYCAPKFTPMQELREESLLRNTHLDLIECPVCHELTYSLEFHCMEHVFNNNDENDMNKHKELLEEQNKIIDSLTNFEILDNPSDFGLFVHHLYIKKYKELNAIPDVSIIRPILNPLYVQPESVVHYSQKNYDVQEYECPVCHKKYTDLLFHLRFVHDTYAEKTDEVIAHYKYLKEQEQLCTNAFDNKNFHQRTNYKDFGINLSWYSINVIWKENLPIEEVTNRNVSWGLKYIGEASRNHVRSPEELKHDAEAQLRRRIDFKMLRELFMNISNISNKELDDYHTIIPEFIINEFSSVYDLSIIDGKCPICGGTDALSFWNHLRNKWSQDVIHRNYFSIQILFGICLFYDSDYTSENYDVDNYPFDFETTYKNIWRFIFSDTLISKRQHEYDINFVRTLQENMKFVHGSIHGTRIDVGYAHSTWEANIYRIFKYENKSFEREIIFDLKDKDGSLLRYIVDIKDIDGLFTTPGEFIEIKGHMDERSIKKIAAFREQTPHSLIIIGTGEHGRFIPDVYYQDLIEKYQPLISMWETDDCNARTNPEKFLVQNK